MKPLRLTKTNARRASRILYDFENKGGYPVRSVLTEPARRNLRNRLDDMRELFRDRSGSYKNAYQEFYLLAFGEADEPSHPPPAPVQQLKERFARWYRLLARHAPFETIGSPNSIMAQRYPEGSRGITPHRDESRFVNLIAIFVLEGVATFGICENRDREGGIDYALSPGDVMLLRAPRVPRVEEEKSHRPMHYVGPVEKSRLSLTFRECVDAA